MRWSPSKSDGSSEILLIHLDISPEPLLEELLQAGVLRHVFGEVHIFREFGRFPQSPLRPDGKQTFPPKGAGGIRDDTAAGRVLGKICIAVSLSCIVTAQSARSSASRLWVDRCQYNRSPPTWRVASSTAFSVTWNA